MEFSVDTPRYLGSYTFLWKFLYRNRGTTIKTFALMKCHPSNDCMIIHHNFWKWTWDHQSSDGLYSQRNVRYGIMYRYFQNAFSVVSVDQIKASHCRIFYSYVVVNKIKILIKNLLKNYDIWTNILKITFFLFNKIFILLVLYPDEHRVGRPCN